MSDQTQMFSPPSKVVSIIDPRMRINQDRIQAISIGPKQNTYRPITADSSLNVSTVNFNYNATSVYDIIDRRFYVKYFLRVAIVGVGNPLTSYGSDAALRFMPINATCTSMQLTLNNASQTVIPFQWIDGISRYIPMDILRKDLSASPSCPDLMHSYSSVAAGAAPFRPALNVTGPKNVLNDYTNNSVDSPDLRGSQARLTALTEGNNASSFDFEIVEPLFVPPLAYQEKDLNGFVGVESLSLQLSHAWTGGNAFSYAGSNALNDFTFSFYNTPQLFLNVLSPNELVEPYNPNRTYTYNSSFLRHYVTTAGSIAAGASTTISAQNIQLNSIPSRIYVFARRVKNGRTSVQTDTFHRINSVSVSLGNKTGLLSTADARQLFEISHKNGYAYSFDAFNFYQGSVLCLKPSEDLSLDLGEAPGLVIQKQLQIDVNVTNQTSAAIDTELVIVPVLQGAFYLKNGQASQSIGLLDPNQILNAPISTDMEYYMYANKDIYGSGLGDWLKKVAKAAWPIVKEVGKSVALPLIKKSLGLGRGGTVLGGTVLGGRRKPGRPKGAKSKRAGMILGGCLDCDDVNVTSRSKLKKMFQKMK